jgi:hypothetical protein
LQRDQLLFLVPARQQYCGIFRCLCNAEEIALSEKLFVPSASLVAEIIEDFPPAWKKATKTRSTPAILPIHSSTTHLVDGCKFIGHTPSINWHAISLTFIRFQSYNEHLRLSKRRLHFDVNELCRVVAQSVGLVSTHITLFTKIAEGGSYRVFEATFRDGLKVIARLPHPSAIPRKYGFASEVATMKYLRIHGVPIPKVFDRNSSASNKIGSEYIIMERV